MRKMLGYTVAAAAFALAGTATALETAAAADALATQGIGTTNCARVANDLKPADGLANPINLLLYAWVQGYVSAANISMLEDGGKHVDMAALDERKVLYLVSAFCKANPDARPVAAIDEMIRTSPKLQGKWEPGTVAWDE
jgi:hypothetical protein